MADITDLLRVCLLLLAFLFSYIALDKLIKNVIQGSVISYNSPKLAYNTVTLKNKKKNRELVFSTMARNLLEGKKSLLFLLIVRGKVGADY